MYRDGSGRTLVDILFSRKREVDGFPWLKGGEEIARAARRNKAESLVPGARPKCPPPARTSRSPHSPRTR